MHRHQADVIAYLIEENRVLREHQGVGRHDRGDAVEGTSTEAPGLCRESSALVIGQPKGAAIPLLIALKWTYEAKRVGRPGVMKAIAALIVRMARENSSWGYSRIEGELKDISTNGKA